jgi:microcystin-dependent protein
MADKFVFSNFATTSLSEAIGTTETVIQFNVDDVPKFPTLTGGAKFPIVLANSDSEVEIMYVTALTMDGSATVERGMEGTQALSWLAGTRIRHTFTAVTVIQAAGLRPRGTWDSGVAYSPNDLIVHGGTSYIAITENLNSAPSGASTDWQVVYVPPGAATTSMQLQGVWNSSTTYAQGHVVVYRGRLWHANATNDNSPPAYGNANWTHLGKWSGQAHYEAVLFFTGTNNYLVAIAANEAPTELYDGLTIRGTFQNSNTAGTVTLQINALSAVPLQKALGVGFASGEIVAGERYEFIYHAASGAFVAASVPSGTAAALAAANATITALQTKLSQVSPVGKIIDWAGDASVTPPTGYLVCNGQAVSRATYALLFAVCGTTYGAGNGTTTFNLPDLRSRVTAGRDYNIGGLSARLSAHLSASTRGAVGGSQYTELHTHVLTDPGHNHPVTDPTHAHSETGLTNVGTAAAGGGAPIPGAAIISTTFVATGISVGSNDTGITLGNFGTGNAGNVQPTMVMEKLIYTGVH